MRQSLLGAPRAGLLPRSIEGGLAQCGTHAAQSFTYILATIACNLQPHIGKREIGLHASALAENLAQVDRGLHVAILSRQQEQSERSRRILCHAMSRLVIRALSANCEKLKSEWLCNVDVLSSRPAVARS